MKTKTTENTSIIETPVTREDIERALNSMARGVGRMHEELIEASPTRIEIEYFRGMPILRLTGEESIETSPTRENLLHYVRSARLSRIGETSTDSLNQQLIRAAMQGETELIQDLLDAGAEIEAKDRFNFTALQYAFLHNHQGTALILIEYGAKLIMNSVNILDSFNNFFSKQLLQEELEFLIEAQDMKAILNLCAHAELIQLLDFHETSDNSDNKNNFITFVQTHPHLLTETNINGDDLLTIINKNNLTFLSNILASEEIYASESDSNDEQASATSKKTKEITTRKQILRYKITPTKEVVFRKIIVDPQMKMITQKK